MNFYKVLATETWPMSPNSKKLIGALIAAGLAIAVYYGLLDQQTATKIQGQANQTLETTPASQQPAPPAAPAPAPPPASAPAAPAPQAPAPTPHQ